MGAFDKIVSDAADTSAPSGGGAFDALIKPPASGPAPSALERIGRGVLDPIEGGAQLLYNALPKGVVEAGNKVNNALAKYGLVAPISEAGLSADINKREQDYQARRGEDAGSTDWYRIGGNVVSPANLALGGTGLGTTLGARAALGAASGAASSALSPVYDSPDSGGEPGADYWSEKAKQVAGGGLLGGVAPALMSGAARVISPNASRNADLALLRSQGVRPTVGQALGGVAGSLEEKATSYPIAGDFVGAARQRAREDFNRAAIDRVYGPLGIGRDTTRAIGQQGVSDAADAASAAYQRADRIVGHMPIDNQAQGEINNLVNMVGNLPDSEQRYWNGVMNKVQTNITPNNHILPENYKNIDSLLGQNARKFGGSDDPYHQSLGDAFREMRSSLRDNASRANPQAAAGYGQADTAWANLVRVEDAAKRAKLTGGVFTPGQLLGAVQSADQSVRKRAVAHGDALMQDLATAGQNIIGNKVPDSGTAGRLGTMAALVKLGTSPVQLAHTLAAPFAYSPLGQRALVAAVANRPALAHQLAPLLLRDSTALSPAAAQLGRGLFSTGSQFDPNEQ